MASSTGTTRALAIDVRDVDTDALFAPSERYLSIPADGADRAAAPELTANMWREIDAWAAAGDAGLPARPAPMSAAIVARLLEDERRSVTTRRVASIPISARSRAELATLADRLLPALLITRR